MRTRSRLSRGIAWLTPFFFAVVLMSSLARPAVADDDDPPGRVARLSYTRGAVSFEPAGESDWGPAVLNRPITTGDRLWTDDGARGELDLGSSTIRLDSLTGFSFLNLDDQITQIQLSQGTLNIHVRELEPDETFEVDTPNQAFTIFQPGVYRVQANEAGDSTLITVRSGSGEVTGGGETYNISPGLSGEFVGTDYIQGNVFRAADDDDFDRWSRDRDRRDERSVSARYVSRGVVGYEDLDDNGTWRHDDDYGDVWVPRVYAGWAPYRNGHWAWISPWGWTWVDDAPWGYAPFHYGRWVYARNNWCWVPGPREIRPVYAPALVAFVGGPGFGISIGIGGGRGLGNVGWFPLGPREVYVPAYNASREYVTRVNVSNTRVNNITVINVYNNQMVGRDRRPDGRFDRRDDRHDSDIKYVNRTAPGGVTVVSRNTFAGAQPVGRAVIAVNPRDISSAPVGRRADITPTRNSIYGNSAPTEKRVPRPPDAVSNRTVVARTPPPPPPVSFERQQQKLAEHPGQPLQKREVEGIRPSNDPRTHPQVRQVPAGRPAPVDSMGRPINAPPNPPANGIGANPPAGNAPPRANDRRDGPNFGQPTNNPPNRPGENFPRNGGATNAPNNMPPARNEGPVEQNRARTPNVQPPAPPANVGSQPPSNAPANAPANTPSNAPRNMPPVRNDRPIEQNRTRVPNPQTPAPPANVGGNPPQNNAPANPPNTPPTNVAPSRSDRPVEQNRTRVPNPQTPAPPAKVGGNAPQNNAPANAPVNTPTNTPRNMPPVRNDRPIEQNRARVPSGQPSTPPARDERNSQSGRGQQPDGHPPAPAPSGAANPGGKQTPPPHADNRDQKKSKEPDNPPSR